LKALKMSGPEQKNEGAAGAATDFFRVPNYSPEQLLKQMQWLELRKRGVVKPSSDEKG